MERHHSQLERNFCSSASLLSAKMAAETILAPARDIMDTLLELLSTQVVLAGGAVRDALLERPIKDFDLFASDAAFPIWEAAVMTPLTWGTEGEETRSVAEIALGLAAGSIRTLVGYTDCSTPFGKEVSGIFEWIDPASGVETQLIFLREEQLNNKDLTGFVKRMDLGLCRVATSTNKDWYISDEFRADVRNRAITFVERGHGADDIARSARRYERLHNKYPGYDYVVPRQPDGLFGVTVKATL